MIVRVDLHAFMGTSRAKGEGSNLSTKDIQAFHASPKLNGLVFAFMRMAAETRGSDR